MWQYGVIDQDYNILCKFEENFTEEEKKDLKAILADKINTNIQKALNTKELCANDVEKIGIACPGTVRDGNIERARKSRNI